MSLLKRMVDRFLTHLINFLIDLRDLITKPIYTTLSDCITEQWGEVQDCPWCDGIGLLTKNGKPIREVI